MNIITAILSAIFGGSGAASIATNGVKLVSLLTVVPAFWHWYQGHGQEMAVQFNWSQMIFVGLLAYSFIQIAHRASGPNS